MGLLLHPLTIALAILVLLAIASWLHLRHWDARLSLAMPYDEEHAIATPDGSLITLRRIHGDSDQPPVLMVHGVGASHRNIDAEPNLSLARHIAEAGRDVWLVTLRSGRKNVAGEPPVRFRDMTTFDIPIAIDEVLRRTHGDSLDYLGFSMGGILLYAALGRTVRRDKVRRVVIVGSPGRVDLSAFPGWRAFRFFADVGVPEIPFALVRMVAFAVEWIPPRLRALIYNPDNVDRDVVPRAMVNVLTEIPGTLAQDFLRWGFSESGAITYEGAPVVETLSAVKSPALFFAGQADNLAPPETVRLAFDAWGSQDKRFVVLSQEKGQRHDYGHGCLAIGRDLHDDVFEPVRLFLG